MLTLAAQVWREGSLSTDSRRALTKLQSLGVRIDDAVIGFAPSIRTRDAAHEPLTTAIDRGQQVTFAYLKPGQTEADHRTVSPLALVYHEGRWHLHAHDDGVDARRTFLLRRIVGPVVLSGSAASTRPEPDEPIRVLDELEVLTHSAAESTIVAETEGTRVLAVPVDSFDAMLERDPDFARRVLDLESRQLQRLTRAGGTGALA
jgi:proteasome accessory factor B